ncbi:MAG TPA: S8 family serine peptidase, partial [Acidimicrobiales bacterium]|nr:S8 family serine peptidase [Acidimicrobiales bacterium]
MSRPSAIVLAALLVVAMVGVGATPSGASHASPSFASGWAGRRWSGHEMTSGDAALTAAAAKGPVSVIAQLSGAGTATAADAASLQARRASVASASARVAAALPAHSYSHVQALGSQPMVAMTVDAEGLAALRAQPGVVHVSRNAFNKASVAYSDNLVAVGAPTAWSAGDTGAGQTIAIVDTGVDATNPFLAGKVVAEGCYSGGAGSGTSLCPGGVATSTATGSGVNCPLLTLGCYHGTHVAGIAVGGDPAGGSFSGVAPGARIISVDVFTEVTDSVDCGGPSPCIGAFDSDVIQALDYVDSL